MPLFKIAFVGFTETSLKKKTTVQKWKLIMFQLLSAHKFKVQVFKGTFACYCAANEVNH